MGIRLITRSSFRTWQDPQGESETWQDPQGVKRVPPKVATNPEGATNFAKSLLEVGRMGRAWQSCRQEWLDALCPAVSLNSHPVFYVFWQLVYWRVVCFTAGFCGMHSWSSYSSLNFRGKVGGCRSIAEDWTVLGWLLSPEPRAKMVCRSSTSIRQASRQASAHALCFFHCFPFPISSHLRIT